MAEKEQSRMRIIVFKGSGKDKPEEFHFSHGKISIGRQARGGPADRQGLHIQSDRLVSRKHARLCKKGGLWLLEDLGSRHGTRVDGRQIKGEGPVELLPGTPVQMGATEWTLVPSAWLYLRRGRVILYGPCSSSLSYAAFHCGVPVIGYLAARNFGRARSKPMDATLEIEGFSKPSDIRVPALDPGKNCKLKSPKIRFRIEKLRRITEPAPTRLLLKLNGKAGALAGKSMEMLGFWDWSHEPSARKTIAAFVSPRNPLLERLMTEARASLADLAGTEAFGGLLRSGREHGEQLVLQAIYQTLSERHSIHWLPPEITLS
ncbi:MAG: FHA domain-containing protein, partial [Planctomycetes bacterium]|nr:FHA domain-containing protein [Planctomycetota bacterium]